MKNKKSVQSIALALCYVGEHQEDFEKWLRDKAVKNNISHLDKIMKNDKEKEE